MIGYNLKVDHDVENGKITLTSLSTVSEDKDNVSLVEHHNAHFKPL